MPSAEKKQPSKNRLLTALPKKDYRRLLPEMESVPLILGEILFEPGDQLKHVYFPDDGIISLLTAVEDHQHLEVGIVGNEGMACLPVFLGVARSRSRGLVQGVGTAMRMTAATLRRETDGGGALHKMLNLYSHALLTQISQSAACNRFHSGSMRLARWLLMTHDRVEGDEFRMTQEFLSRMLGGTREQVTVAASTLKKQHLIGYSRGRIEILDRVGLEAAACKCYRVVKDEYDNFLN